MNSNEERRAGAIGKLVERIGGVRFVSVFTLR
nr:MAG TPA: hypothetical protein [Caudoviricetes sp.]